MPEPDELCSNNLVFPFFSFFLFFVLRAQKLVVCILDNIAERRRDASSKPELTYSCW